MVVKHTFTILILASEVEGDGLAPRDGKIEL